MKSQWGNEDPETLVVLDKIKLDGRILNLAAGDGRFNNKLLESGTSVVALDIDEAELVKLSLNCPDEFKSRLSIAVADMTEKLPFEDNSFDSVFNTGTLHLFNIEIIEFIVSEMRRVLRPNGKIVFDFATDIKRVKADGSLITFAGEGHYQLDEAKALFMSLLSDFEIMIEDATCFENDLELDGVNYDFSCKFLVISGKKINFQTSD